MACIKQQSSIFHPTRSYLNMEITELITFRNVSSVDNVMLIFKNRFCAFSVVYTPTVLNQGDKKHPREKEKNERIINLII